MFKSLKLFTGQTIPIEDILSQLIALGYKKGKSVHEEGDLAQRGGVIDIFPSNFDSPVRIDFDGERIRSICSFSLKTGEPFWDHKIVIVLAKKIRPGDISTSEAPLNNFVDIEKGDYVVHHHHGIGRFLGIKRLDIDPQKREHLIIEYQGGDRLYVPQKDMHLIQKYVGFTKKPPRVFKLGSPQWKRMRTRIQKRIQRFAGEILHLQALRLSLKGFSFPPDNDWQEQFESRFPFQETPDQIRASVAVKEDMTASYPMDRLICGDVGYGKTEVSMRASFKAVMGNKQVAILVPTTILAEQHFYNFSLRFKDFPVNIAMLSRFRTKTEQMRIIRELGEGRVDIVIGTHRLLSDDIHFKDLGLIIIDEEQRFGVKAKEKLKHLRLFSDILTMTATPIPRTLYMALSGAKEMSVINTPPDNRIPVTTYLVEFNEELIKDAIDRELKRHGQVFFLHNRVEDIEKVGATVQRLVPHARLAVAHGQMPPRLLEEIMLKFLKGQLDVLVCTTIVESGIDIPNANTLIVNRADRFGLAELHQLRGRVGRFDKKAYAHLITPPWKTLSSQSKARLNAIVKFSGLGSGFFIAFEDLQIRGAGNLLGEEQHGYISSVGFDLYCRLLKESVEHIKRSSSSEGITQRI